MEIKRYRHRTYKTSVGRCVLDPSRNRLVRFTPEERVRQDTVFTLVEEYGYPIRCIGTEETVSSKPLLRADIVLWGNSDGGDLEPIAVVECKASGVDLTNDHIDQTWRYCDSVGARYMVITNGTDTWVLEKDEAQDLPRLVEDIPGFSESTPGSWTSQYVELDAGPARPTALELADEDWLEEQVREVYSDWIVGVDSDPLIWPLAINMHHLLTDSNLFFNEPISWLGYTMLEDRWLSRHAFGNASGGRFTGDYRSFLVEDPSGKCHLVRFMICATGHYQDNPTFGNKKGRTFLNVAVSDARSDHNSLQLCLDRFVAIGPKEYMLWHDGRMAVGNRGRIPNAKTLSFVADRQPSLVAGDPGNGGRVHLGTIPRGKLLTWEYMSEVILNATVYGLLRDDLRNKVGRRKRKRRKR
jgi:hypothetical protein